MKIVALSVVICLVAALWAGGLAPFGRVFLAAGLPSVAVPLFSDPAWRGVAQYRVGDMANAARSFADAGAVFNLGTAEAMRGEYAAALEAYDIAIAQGNEEARANFEVVAAVYSGLGIDPEALALFGKRDEGPTADSHIARGNARAAGTGDEVTNANTMLGLAELDSRGRLGVRRIFDDKHMIADDRWLMQLADVPGEFLKARIAQEFKRRQKLGLSPPDAEDPR